MTTHSLSQLAAILKEIQFESFKVVSVDKVDDFLDQGYILWGSPLNFADHCHQAIAKIKPSIIGLSKRQKECYQLKETGLTIKEIAKQLSLAESTVRRHLAGMERKRQLNRQ